MTGITINLPQGGGRYDALELGWGTYADKIDGKPVAALQLTEDPDRAEFPGEVVATASVNLPGLAPPEGCIWVKDWSENTGMFDSLIAANVIADAHLTMPVGPFDAKARAGRVLEPFASGMRATLADRS